MLWKNCITLAALLTLTTVKANQQFESASISHVSVPYSKSHRHKKGGLGYKSNSISSAHYANEYHSGSRSRVYVETPSVKLIGWGYDREGDYYECNPYDKNCPFGDTYHEDKGYDSKHSYAGHSHHDKQEHSHHGEKGHDDFYHDEDSCPYGEDECAENPTCSPGTTITRVVRSTATVYDTISSSTSISEHTTTSSRSDCPVPYALCPPCPEGATCKVVNTINSAGCPFPSVYCDPTIRGASPTASLISSYPTTFNSETTY
ncbi:hypothetical protein BD770DRAFT_414453 [Pilaira anomala]|nr:hypothetical protein BD770DRAFT_414453 [Pilaira anomala]